MYFGYAGEDFVPTEPILAVMDANPDIAGLLDLRYGVGYAGNSVIKTFSYAPVGDGVPIVLTEGGVPRSPTDVVLAPTSARQLGAAIGSSVTITGDGETRTLRVVGLGFAPEATGDTGDYGEGAWVTAGGYDTLFRGFEGHGGTYAWREGVDPPRRRSGYRSRSGRSLAARPPVSTRWQIRSVSARSATCRCSLCCSAGSSRCSRSVRSGTRWPLRCGAAATTSRCCAPWA